MLNSNHIGLIKHLCIAACTLSLFYGCADAGDIESPSDHPQVSTDEPALESGKKRLYIRTSFGIDPCANEIIVNGVSHTPIYNPSKGQWFVDTEVNAFNAYSAELRSEKSLYWYDGTSNSDILLPVAQHLHKMSDLDAIPMFAEYNPDKGEYLEFIPPYATLEIEAEGMEQVVSIRVEADKPLCGTAVWSRTKGEFIFSGTSKEVVLNCTQNHDTRAFEIRVFGQNYSNVTLRICNRFHKAKEISLGNLELTPGISHKITVDATPENDLILFEGFDRCVWGGDPVEKDLGFAPSEDAPTQEGDITKDGYEYALTSVPADMPGSGFIQGSFANGQSEVHKSHNMSDSYVKSRGFTENRYMLRCQEYRGYISVGTGDTKRGWFALYPLKETGFSTVKNLEISFKIALHRTCTDDVLLLINGSQDVITKYYIDEAEGSKEAVSQYGTSDTLRLSPSMLGKERWRTIKVHVDNCTDLTALHWQAASSENGAHGFYLDDICIREVKDSWKQDGKLRILYWNIQNGMWGDQPDYNDFVDFVKKYNPDICVWCEAKSNHLTGSDASWKNDPYLPDNWPALAARYGHTYTSISRRGTEKFPQVITSKFPIEKLLQLGDIPGSDPILHGAGLFKVSTPGEPAHILTIHLKPNSGLSVAEGEAYRRYEIEHIMDATLNNADYKKINNWIVVGDFNADTRRDAPFHNYIDNGTHYLTHDYIAENTSLTDVMAARYPNAFMYTTASARRIDYVYMDRTAYGKVADACVLTESWTAPIQTALSNFCKPSDHRPILIDMTY